MKNNRWLLVLGVALILTGIMGIIANVLAM